LERNLWKPVDKFFFVPTHLLLEKIKYKAAVEVVFIEESYTGKASFYDRDPLPEYEAKSSCKNCSQGARFSP
jgi:hypothetical protein